MSLFAYPVVTVWCRCDGWNERAYSCLLNVLQQAVYRTAV